MPVCSVAEEALMERFDFRCRVGNMGVAFKHLLENKLGSLNHFDTSDIWFRLHCLLSLNIPANVE